MIRKVIILLSIFFCICIGINLPIVSNAATVTPHVNRSVVHPFFRHHDTNNKGDVKKGTEDSEEITEEEIKGENNKNNSENDCFNNKLKYLV